VLTRITQFYLPPTRSATSEMNQTCLYSAAAERHRTLAGTHFPSCLGQKAELSWQRGTFTSRRHCILFSRYCTQREEAWRFCSISHRSVLIGLLLERSAANFSVCEMDDRPLDWNTAGPRRSAAGYYVAGVIGSLLWPDRAHPTAVLLLTPPRLRCGLPQCTAAADDQDRSRSCVFNHSSSCSSCLSSSS